MARQGPGEQVKVGKTTSAGLELEACRNRQLFGKLYQEQNEGGNLVAKSGADESHVCGWEGCLG